jgi:biotin synthase
MQSMTLKEWEEIFHLGWKDLWPWLGEASRVREAHFGKRVSFCVITNAKSGLCSEDCAFCSQSAVAKTEVPRYPLLPREKLVTAAQEAAAAGASRFSLVTSGRGIIGPRDQEAILEAVAAIRQTVPIKVCASLGIVDHSFLMELKAAGVHRFHHNLEAPASFFSQICSTHTFEDRVATVKKAKDAGLAVCCGGILGLGETVAQRWELAQTLKELEPAAIPLNFLNPLAGTPLEGRPLLLPLEALQATVAFRLTFPDTSLIVCGGRQVTLRSLAPLLFAAGVDSLMTGDYLTTKGCLPVEDREMIADLGLELAQVE